MELLQTNSEFQQFVPVGTQFSIENIKDDIQNTLIDKIFRYIPEAFLQSIIDKDNKSEDEQELLIRVKRATANLAFSLHYALVKVNISDLGITNIGSDDNSKQASKEDKEDVYKSLINKGYSALESAITLLYTRRDSFQAWKESDSYVDLSTLFVRNTDEFKLTKSYRAFLEVIPFIESIEVEFVEMYDKDIIKLLRKNLKENSLSDVQQELLTKYLQPAISMKSAALATYMNAIGRDPNGNISIYQDDGEFTRSKREVAQQKIQNWANKLEELADKRFSLTSKFIQDNYLELGGKTAVPTIETFPLIRNQEDWGTTFH